jgi:hypothetical protein
MNGSVREKQADLLSRKEPDLIAVDPRAQSVRFRR